MNTIGLKVRNFGPITSGYELEDGIMTFPKVTMFCGPQGSGKSTVTKLASAFMWLEKAAYIIGWGDVNQELDGREVVERLLEWHGLKTYFKPNTEIEYRGTYLSLIYNHKEAKIVPCKECIANYSKTKLMYIPAERNFLHILGKSTGVRLLPPPLVALQEVFQMTKETMGKPVPIPVNGYEFAYHEDQDLAVVINSSEGPDSSETPIHEASSGLQSLIPLYLVTEFLSRQIGTRRIFSPRVRSLALSVLDNPLMTVAKNSGEILYARTAKALDAQFYMVRSALPYAGLVNIVEEPEQNLFPPTQRRMLRMLLSHNNRHDENRLVVSTHSPYIVSELMASAEAFALQSLNEKRGHGIEDCATAIGKLYPPEARVDAGNIKIYETDHDGRITELERVGDIFSDKNYLNRHLKFARWHFEDMKAVREVLQGSGRELRHRD